MEAQESKKGVFLLGEDFVKPHGLQVNILCAAFFLLLIIGLANLYSATHGSISYFYNQLRNLIVVIPAFFLAGWLLPIRRVNTYAYWVFGIVCFLLAVVLALGRIAGGAQRWISIGPIGFQPSEFAKLATAVMVARYFSTHRLHSAYRLRDLWPLIGMLLCVFSLIFAQPDFGTAGICLFIALAQLFFIRIDTKSLLLVAFSLPVTAIVGWTLLLRPYQKIRVLTLLDPTVDPQNTGYNSLQSLIAVGSGMFFGKGYLQGTQSQLKFLPERHTDFVFSVFAEEQGFWGCALVFLLFGLMIFIAIDVARHARDTFSALLAIGIAAFLFFESSINIAMVLGIFPVVGLPLPFFSYGSSLLFTISLALGLLIAINRSTQIRNNN